MSGRIMLRVFWWSPSRWPSPLAGLRSKRPRRVVATGRSNSGSRNDRHVSIAHGVKNTAVRKLDQGAVNREISCFRLVVLVLVQKPGDLSSQRRRIQEIAHRSGRVE